MKLKICKPEYFKSAFTLSDVEKTKEIQDQINSEWENKADFEKSIAEILKIDTIFGIDYNWGKNSTAAYFGDTNVDIFVNVTGYNKTYDYMVTYTISITDIFCNCFSENYDKYGMNLGFRKVYTYNR